MQLLKYAFPDGQAATVFWDRIAADQWEVARSAGATPGLQLTGIEFRDQPYDTTKRSLRLHLTIVKRYLSCHRLFSFEIADASLTLRFAIASQIQVFLPRMGRSELDPFRTLGDAVPKHAAPRIVGRQQRADRSQID